MAGEVLHVLYLYLHLLLSILRRNKQEKKKEQQTVLITDDQHSGMRAPFVIATGRDFFLLLYLLTVKYSGLDYVSTLWLLSSCWL